MRRCEIDAADRRNKHNALLTCCKHVQTLHCRFSLSPTPMASHIKQYLIGHPLMHGLCNSAQTISSSSSVIVAPTVISPLLNSSRQPCIFLPSHSPESSAHSFICVMPTSISMKLPSYTTCSKTLPQLTTKAGQRTHCLLPMQWLLLHCLTEIPPPITCSSMHPAQARFQICMLARPAFDSPIIHLFQQHVIHCYNFHLLFQLARRHR